MMELDLNIVWYGLIGLLLAGYAILDGFDLGVGALHLFVRKDKDRRILLNAIGPVWDGNEVWLVTGGGALFAAFPEAYATIFSGFYMAFMLFLCALIFRAVAIEFRSKREGRIWRGIWDVAFSVSSIVSSVLLGVALGNLIWGIPLDANHEFTGTFFTLIHPYSLLVGVMMLALFMMHGCIYLIMKTEGELQERLKGWIKNTIIFFVVTYALTSMATLIYAERMIDRFRDHPTLFVFPVLTMLAIANIPREVSHGREFRAFLSSCFAVLGFMSLYAIGAFPYLVLSTPDPSASLNIYNAASSPMTLNIMLIMAILGIPLVLAYTASIYYVFRGKVHLDAMSY